MRLSLRSLWLGLAVLALPAAAQTARLQVVHNAADPALAVVDVYVDGVRALDDLAFRSATPFLTLPAGVALSVAVAPGASASAAEAVFTRTVILGDAQRAQLVATGVREPAAFAPNPDGRTTALDLVVVPGVRETPLPGSPGAPSSGLVSLRMVHGATDAPTLDVRNGGSVLYDDLAYTDPSGYVTLFFDVVPSAYPLVVERADGTRLAAFSVDLASVDGEAVTAFASGFLDPAANQNGPPLGLLLVRADGSTQTLAPETAVARVQVIHAAADPALALVDVYLDGVRTLDDFPFLAATPFVALPAGGAVTVAVAPGTSASAADAFYTATLPLPAGDVQLVATGVLEPAAFAPNPDGRPTAFDLVVRSGARVESTVPNNALVSVVHAATDAPVLGVALDDAPGSPVPPPVDAVGYGAASAYRPVPFRTYEVGVTRPDAMPLGPFTLDLPPLGYDVVTIVATGFARPAANGGGPAFGLLAVYADGTTEVLPVLDRARVQVVHAAADPALALVDVYVDGALAFDDLAFGTATPFVDVPTDGPTPLLVGLAPSTSTGPGDAVSQTVVLVRPGAALQLIATGVGTPSAFAPNPDGVPTDLGLVVAPDAMEVGSVGSVTAVRVVHTAPDAPALVARLDTTVVLGGTASSFVYTDVSAYRFLEPASYTFGVETAADGTPLGTFQVDITGAGGAAVTLIASGFVDPAANQNGPAFAVLAVAVLPDGSTRMLTGTSVGTPAAPAAGALALGASVPNPLSGRGTVGFSLDAPGRATLALYDALGRRVAVLAEGDFSADRHEATLATAGLAAGVYVLRLESASGARSRTVTVVR